MAYQTKDMSGSLFSNDRKRGERDPDLSGKVMINGQMFFVSAWEKPGKEGASPWLSLSFKPANQERTPATPAPYQPPQRPAQPSQQAPQSDYGRQSAPPQAPASRWKR